MKNSRFIQLALAASLVFATGVPAFAARDQSSKDISKFKDQLQKEANVSKKDIDAIEPELREYSQHNGDPKQLSEVAKTAVQNNCTGNCLSDTLKAMNTAMAKGLTDRDAQTLVNQTLREQVQARNQGAITEQELGGKVRASVDEKLSTRATPPSGPSGREMSPGAPEQGAPGSTPMAPGSTAPGTSSGPASMGGDGAKTAEGTPAK